MRGKSVEALLRTACWGKRRARRHVVKPRARGGVAVAIALVAAGCQPLPNLRFDRRPLSITEPLDATTRGRLLQATQEPQACAAWLAAAGLTFRAVADRAEGGGCVVTGAGNLVDTARPADPPLSPPRPMMACDLAAAVAIWRRQSVEPAAREILGAEIQRINHLGVYACRGVGDPVTGRPSAHARAKAIDIAGFKLANGRQVTVDKHWKGQGAEARFLRRVRDDGCRLFGVVLSPDYNAAHANHLHFEMGRGGLCG